MELLNLASIRLCTESEGPGRRFALWCQGCLNRCPGCCNTEMQPIEKRHIVSIDDLEQIIWKAKEEKAIEGVSFIGGEPFLQAKSLSSLAKWCWENDLSVLVFTGYTLSEIKAMNMEGSSDLLDHCDLLIDGPYIQSQADDKRPWIGSKNQTVHNLTARYPEGIEYVANRAMEILINDDSILVNGWPWLID